MKLIINIACLFLCTVALGGCYYDNEAELYPSNFCDVTSVTFSGTIKPLIQTRCALPGCHVTGATSPDLAVDQNIKTIGDDGRLKARVIDRIPPAMPPSGPLPGCELLQLQAWLDAGAPINN